MTLTSLRALFAAIAVQRPSVRGLTLGAVAGVMLALFVAGSASAAPTPYESAVLGDSPAGYWRLGESSGTTAADRTGHGYDGAFVGTPALGVPGAVADDPDTAVAFNGTSQYAQVPYAAALNPVAPFTVEAWAKLTGGAGSVRTVVASRAFNPSRGYMLSASSSGAWEFLVGTGGSAALPVTGPMAHLNTWTHLVGTVEKVGTDLHAVLYVNGSFAAEQTFSMTSFPPNTTQALRIGADTGPTPARFFPGSIDEVAVYSGALPVAQIANHFSNAAIFHANTTSDTIDTNFDGVCADQNGQCSLRAAIIEADFLFGPAVIKLPAGTFTLTRGPADDEGKNCFGGAEYNTGDLDIYAPVTIAGAGVGSTIVEMGTLSPSGTICGATATKDRIFDVDNDGVGGGSYDGLDVTISGMTLRNGAAPLASGGIRENGGAIRYSGLHYDPANRKGTLRLRDCAITNNSAAGNGGGVYAADGIVSIDDCSFTGNTTNLGAGGALAFNGGSYAANAPAAWAGIANSTFSANRAGRGGGGAISLMNAPGPGFLRNTTLSGNSADVGGGGLLVSNGSIALTNATVTNNRSDADASNGGAGGGLNVAGGTLTLGNTIVAGNFTGTASTASDVAGAAAAGSSFNLIGTGGSGGLTNGTNGNQVGVASPGLATLGDNGGSTQTHALLPDSPALDAGSNDLAASAGLAADQRGAPFSRLRDSADANTTATVDIGALEQHPSLANIADQATNENAPISVPFDVGDANAGFDSIGASSSNTTLVPNSNLVVSGSGASRTLGITPAADQAGTTTITVTVTSTVGGKTSSASDTFVLTVNALPTVSLTAPADGSTFVTPAAITINASAFDSDGSVNQVDFYHDGVLIGTDMTAPYSVTYSGPTVGPHSLTARATDNLLATKTSAAVGITVHDPPTVSVTSPANGSFFATPSAIPITADAADDGSVAQVDFFRDGVLIGTDTTAPYTASYSSPTAGPHSLTARATDNYGATTTSSAVSITVHNPPTISVTAPANGAIFLNRTVIAITANASDDGSVSKVDFFRDGALIGTDTTAPYGASFKNPTIGVHSLTARATDDHGATKTSSAVSIEVFAPATNYVNAVLADSPTAYWRLDESKGTTVFDRTGNQNTGGFYGSPTLGSMGALTGDSDKAVTFNGTTQYAQVPYRLALNPAPPYSIEVWAKPTGGEGTTRAIVTSRAISPPRGYALFAGPGGLWQVSIGDGSANWRTLTGLSTTLNEWTHLVVTVAPASGGFQVTLYVNGAQAAQQTFAALAANTTRPLRFAAGRTESTPIQYFPGTLDEIGFYKTALSAARVSAHYATGKAG